jgi:enoyl-CoA hydratase/carnithine racemase
VPTPDLTTVHVAVDGPVGRHTLDRPEKLNPLGTTTLRELVDAAQWFDEQPAVKVVVVGGRGRAFSAGADLASFEPGGGRDVSTWDAADAGRAMADAVEAMQAVTVAAIHGFCIGGGVVLAAACDLRIAADDTVFSIPEVDLGIPLAWGGVPRLVRELGPTRTRELVMTCRRFTAQEAEAWGFLNRAVPRDRLDEAATDLARTLAEKSHLTLTATKEAVAAVTRGDDPGPGTDGLVQALSDPESREVGRRYLSNLRRS